MDFLKWLADFRTPLMDTVMGFITKLGEEALFILVALIVFWCIDKKRGYFLLFIGFTGTIINQFLKMLFRIPRPWILDPDFQIVESARAEATGYSFPSGHTQVASTTYLGLARSTKRVWLSILFAFLTLLVGFSRMYLGVHTPKDVLVSLAVGIVLVLVLYPIVDRFLSHPGVMFSLILAILFLTIGNIVFLNVYPFPADVDPANLSHAVENAWKMLGLALSMAIVYPLDQYVIKFETDCVWWAQILKLAVGFGIVMAIKSLLKAPLNAAIGADLGNALRYFLLVIVAGTIYPIFFRFLPKKKQKS